MDPITTAAAATAVLKLVDWDKVAHGLANDEATKGAKALLARLKTSDKEKAARVAVHLFTVEFLRELEGIAPLSQALPGYQDHLKVVLEAAAPDIAAWLHPETKSVDLGPVERMWSGISPDRLPEDFDWSRVAGNYARAIRTHIRGDQELRPQLQVALQEEQIELQRASTAALHRLAPNDPGFHLDGYRDYLRAKCGHLQLAALDATARHRQMRLWSVFVPQSARESVPARDLPRELLRQLRREGHIKDELTDEQLEDRRQAYSTSAVSPILDILARQRLVVILGDPGSGKTCLLKYAAMRWVNQQPKAAQAQPLPLWIDLRAYAHERIGFLKFCESGCTAFGLDAGRVEQGLAAGQAALYLDGLDEVFDPVARASIVEEITAFVARHPAARIVVTSRIVGYEPEPLTHAGFTHATLEDFDDAQLAEFIDRWHIEAEEDEKQREHLRQRLARALQESRAIRELAGNPLLLTMMAILGRNQELPRDRVDLYAQASRVLLYEWDANRALAVDVFERQEKEELLRELAGAMQQAEFGLSGNLIERTRLIELIRKFLMKLAIPDPHTKATRLVQQLTERNFILCFAGADHFAFVHRTFLEYYCAAWFVDQFQRQQTLSLDQLRDDVFGQHWRDETWHEVLRLIAGMVGERQAEALIRFLMEQDGRDDELENLMLAAGCLSEVRNRQTIRATDEALWAIFTEAVIRYEPRNFYESYGITVVVQPTRTKAVQSVAHTWRSEGAHQWLLRAAASNEDWMVRMAAVRELSRGWKNDPQTLPFLQNLARSNENADVRVVAVQEWARGWNDDPPTLPFLQGLILSGVHPHLQAAAVQELARGRKGDPQTLPFLQDLARSDANYELRVAAVQEWARGWRDDPQTLPFLQDRALSDNDDDAWVAVQELARGWKDDPQTLPILQDRACYCRDAVVRWAAVRELERGWKDDPQTLPILQGRARVDKDANVRRAALRALAQGWRDDLRTLPIFQDSARSDKDSNVRRTAIQALAQGWREEAQTLSILRHLARPNRHPAVQAAAVRELARGWMANPQTLPFLQNCVLSAEDAIVRAVAVHELALGWRCDPQTLPILQDRARSDQENEVRRAAVEELARGWKDDSQTLPILQDRARSDKHVAVRRTAVQELERGWKGDSQTLPILQDRARSDKHATVRKLAVQELARGWRKDPTTLLLLLDRACSDKNEHVRSAARSELKTYWPDHPEVMALLQSQ